MADISMPTLPNAGAHRPRLVRPIAKTGAKEKSGRLAYWLLVILVIYNLLNFGALYTRAFGSAIPINPLMFVLLGLPIFLMTSRPRGRNRYFGVAWFFWVVFAFFGFLGPYQITGVYIYGTFQEIFKNWISLIGIPLLATRAIPESRLPHYAKVCVILITIGAILAIVQLIWPNAFGELTSGGGRGAGLWINPNLCAAMCATGILFSLMYPFKFKSLTLVLQAIMFCGIASTLSRGGILACLVAFAVYGFLTLRWTTMIQVTVILIFVVIGGIMALEPLKQSTYPGLAQRAEGIQQMLRGDIGEQTVQGRWSLWRGGFMAARQNWLFGRGHGSMHSVVKTKYLEGMGRWHAIGPHNYYIYVLGNSGIFALLALCVYWANLIRLAYRCRLKKIRAGLFAMIALFMVLAMASHSLFNNQFLGLLLAVFVLSAHYGRRGRPNGKPTRAAVPRPIQPTPAIAK